MSGGRILLVRHGSAGERGSAGADDSVRPLTVKGERQAAVMPQLLAKEALTRVVTSPYRRCRQTIEPLAAARGVTVEEAAWLIEGSSPEGALAQLMTMAGDGVAACTHGDIIGGILEHLWARGVDLGAEPRMQKGSVWILETASGGARAARYLPPPG